MIGLAEFRPCAVGDVCVGDEGPLDGTEELEGPTKMDEPDDVAAEASGWNPLAVLSSSL